MKPVQFGIIGPGAIARKFADAINRTPEANLYAVAAREYHRAKAFQKEFSAEIAYGSYLELMKDPYVDVIYIAVPHNFHYEIVRQCLLHDKAVLCEKPMTINEAEAIKLVSLARQRKLLLVEAMWTRMLPAYLTAKRWLQEGKIGTLKLIQASFCRQSTVTDPSHRLLNPQLAGGSLWDIGVYPLSFATGITDSAPSSVTSFASITETGVDDTCSMLLQFKHDVTAHLTASFRTNTSCEGTLHGTKGIIRIPHFYKATICEYYDHKDTLIERFEEPCKNGFVYEVAHVCDLFLQGKLESPLISWEDTILSGKLFDTIRLQWST